MLSHLCHNYVISCCIELIHAVYIIFFTYVCILFVNYTFVVLIGLFIDKWIFVKGKEIIRENLNVDLLFNNFIFFIF